MCSFPWIALGFWIFFRSFSERVGLELRFGSAGEFMDLRAAWLDEFVSSCSPMTGPVISPDSVLFNYIIFYLTATNLYVERDTKNVTL